MMAGQAFGTAVIRPEYILYCGTFAVDILLPFGHLFLIGIATDMKFETDPKCIVNSYLYVSCMIEEFL